MTEIRNWYIHNMKGYDGGIDPVLVVFNTEILPDLLDM
jgi:hypothetical protein